MALRCGACDHAGLRPRPAGKQNTAGQPKAKIDDPEGDAYKKAQLGASARVRTGHNNIAHGTPPAHACARHTHTNNALTKTRTRTHGYTHKQRHTRTPTRERARARAQRGGEGGGMHARARGGAHALTRFCRWTCRSPGR